MNVRTAPSPPGPLVPSAHSYPTRPIPHPARYSHPTRPANIPPTHPRPAAPPHPARGPTVPGPPTHPPTRPALIMPGQCRQQAQPLFQRVERRSGSCLAGGREVLGFAACSCVCFSSYLYQLSSNPLLRTPTMHRLAPPAQLAPIPFHTSISLSCTHTRCLVIATCDGGGCSKFFI